MAVFIGDDTRWIGGDIADSDKGGLAFGNALVDADEYDLRAEAATHATILGFKPMYAWAEVGRDFHILESDGETEREAEIRIKGSYKGSRWTAGGATSSTKAIVEIYDWDDDTVVKNTELHDGSSSFADYVTFEDDFDVTLNVDLESGKQYAFIIRAKTTSLADGGDASASFEDSGKECYVEADEVLLNWQ